MIGVVRMTSPMNFIRVIRTRLYNGYSLVVISFSLASLRALPAGRQAPPWRGEAIRPLFGRCEERFGRRSSLSRASDGLLRADGGHRPLPDCRQAGRLAMTALLPRSLSYRLEFPPAPSTRTARSSHPPQCVLRPSVPR